MGWQKLASRIILDDEWITLRADRCRLDDGREIDPYYVLEERDWVHVVPVNEQGEILVVRQYRHAAGVTCWEAPGGVLHEGEDPVKGAARELSEETGALFDDLLPTGEFYANPARQTNKVFCFLATNARIAGPQRLDPTEDISFEFITVDSVLKLIDTGAFSQGLHIASLFFALRKLQDL